MKTAEGAPQGMASPVVRRAWRALGAIATIEAVAFVIFIMSRMGNAPGNTAQRALIFPFVVVYLAIMAIIIVIAPALTNAYVARDVLFWFGVAEICLVLSAGALAIAGRISRLRGPGDLARAGMRATDPPSRDSASP